MWSTLALLSLAGLRAALATPVRQPASSLTAQQPADLMPWRVAGFAELFARAYLNFDPANPDAHDRAVAALAGPNVDPQGLVTPNDKPQIVGWTSPVSVERVSRRVFDVTVAVAIAGRSQLLYLASSVGVASNGAMAVLWNPGVVGAPAHASELALADRPPLSDPALATVAARALRNYLAGARENLRADLLPGVELPSPASALRVVGDVQLSTAGRGRVGADLSARDASGVAFELHYVLAVVRRERWYVAAINPSTEGAVP